MSIDELYAVQNHRGGPKNRKYSVGQLADSIASIAANSFTSNKKTGKPQKGDECF